MTTHVEYRVYGTHKRDHLIADILASLQHGAEVYYDDRKDPGDPGCACLYTCRKAFTDIPLPGTTHICALQDDVRLCQGFCQIIDRIVAAHPNAIICLFPFDHCCKNDYADAIMESRKPYVQVRANTGQGIIMPVRYIDDCFDYAERVMHNRVEEAVAIHAYALSRNIKIITTIPATLQHIGDTSTLFSDAPIRRTPYFRMDPQADWSCKEIAKNTGGLHYDF